MGPRATKAAASGVAAGLTAVGVSVDSRLGTRPLATGLAAAAAVVYAVGTCDPRARVFGAPARARAGGGPATFALTFDDGPDPRHTSEISSQLARRGHRATFFVLARAVNAHPQLAAAVLEDGHELACHGDDHRLLAFASPREVDRQLLATELAVRRATGRPPARLFRPPHGVRSPWLTWVVGRRGYRVCAWNGSVFDTAEPGAATIVARVTRLLAPGRIVLLHDGDGSGRGASRRQTVEALPGILDAAERRGLRAVPVGALLESAVTG